MFSSITRKFYTKFTPKEGPTPDMTSCLHPKQKPGPMAPPSR
jgi:hypothetical protein